MKHQFPIEGKIPTSYTIGSAFDPESDQAKRFARIYTPSCRIGYMYPPRPLEFTRENYSPRGNSTPITLQEFYSKASLMPLDSLLAILMYDSGTMEFDVEPMEIICRIDYNEEDESLHLYAAEYTNNKMIEFSQLQSHFETNDRGDIVMVKQHRGKDLLIAPETPLYLYTKSQGKQKVDDIITFSGSVGIGHQTKKFIGLVIYS